MTFYSEMFFVGLSNSLMIELYRTFTNRGWKSFLMMQGCQGIRDISRAASIVKFR